ncbi:MAG: Mov34/MPN/PAD-1 family protein, partial [Planctomycetota bacterium]
RFEMDPVEFARRERELREAGLSICGFFHSHPDGPATPSPADVATAWPRHVQLILGMRGGKGSRLTAWHKDRGTGALRQIQVWPT